MSASSDRLEIEASPAKTLLLGLGALLFVAGGVWIARTTPADAFIHLAGWLAILFFGLCAGIIFSRGATLRGAVVAMDRDGLTDRRVSDQPIPWKKVQAISTWSHQGNKAMILKLDPAFDAAFPTKTITRMTRGMNAKLGADGIAVSPTGLRIGYEAMLAAAIRFRQEAETR